jgi:hypothetical protein
LLNEINRKSKRSRFARRANSTKSFSIPPVSSCKAT